MFTNDNPPDAGNYLNAVNELKHVLKGFQITILRTQYSSPGRAVTSQIIRDTLGYGEIGQANLTYGTLCKLFGKHMNFSVADRPAKRPGWWRVLSTGDGEGEHFTWIMRPQLALALEHAGIVDPSDDGIIDAPDVDYSQGFIGTAIEGRRQLVTHLRRERSQGLIASKKASVKSLECEICGFNSEAFYGVVYCEAHHLTPLASLSNDTETALDDLALVCANCHRIIHSRFPPFSLDELTDMIKNQKQKSEVAGENAAAGVLFGK